MFRQGDKVTYVGEKFSDLNGKLGIICAQIIGNPRGYVVDFDDSYVMDESKLAPFQGHLKSEPEEKKKKEPKVEKRRGGKNRSDDSDEE